MPKEVLASWRCDGCKQDSGSVNSRSDSEDSNLMETLKTIRRELTRSVEENRSNFNENRENVAELNKTVNSIKVTLDSVQERITVVESENVALKEKCDFLCEQNDSLHKEVSNIRSEFEMFKQYSRNHNLEIKGIPLTPNEEIYCILESVAKTLQVPYNNNDVSTAHRLQKPRNPQEHPSIVVQFISRTVRASWLTAAKKIRIKASDLVATLPATPVFVNEHLTPANKAILGRSKYLARKQKLTAAWTRDGVIYIRKTESSPARRVTSVEEVNSVAEVPPGDVPEPKTPDNRKPTSSK